MGSHKKPKKSESSIEKPLESQETEESFDKAVLKHLPSGPNRGIFWDVVCSIFEPGVNSGLMLVIHVIFSSLLLVQIFFIFTLDPRNIHLWILFVLSAALYPSLIIFVQEAERVRLEGDKSK
jgi:hypothetical protein